MIMLITLIAVNISQHICVSKNHIVRLKYIQSLIVNYTSVKLGWKKGMEAVAVRILLSVGL